MLKKFTLLIISVLLLLCAGPALADAEYSIENYAMYIGIQPDGSADVTEALCYDFDGEYNGILSLFDTDGIEGIADFQVTIDGVQMTQVDEMTYTENTYTVTEVDEDLFEVRIYSPGQSDRRTVVYEYTMRDLARRYADTGMIHRKLIGENNSVTLKQAGIVINFPGNADLNSIEAFLHGGMDNSQLTRDNRSLSIGPDNVRPGESVELRLLFPPSWLAEAPIINENMYESAIAEETRIAQEEKARAVRTENAKYLFAAVYLLVFFSAWAVLAKKYGLKKRVHESADPRRILNHPAAFLTAALEDEADTDALTGTLMELVADGSIRMETEGEGLRFTRLKTDMTGYYPHQQTLMDWLFDGREFFLLSDLNAGKDYARAQRFETGYNRYISQVSDDMLAAGLRYKNDALRITVNALVIILGAMGVGGILLAGTPNILLGILVGGALFALIALMSRVRRLTDEGERLQADAEAFKTAGIASDSDLAEHIACYAALGLTEPLVQFMERDGFDSPADTMPRWMYTGWYYSLHTLNISMRDTHYHNASIPDPNASSSSGGGHSNGGGGGHGAW